MSFHCHFHPLCDPYHRGKKAIRLTAYLYLFFIFLLLPSLSWARYEPPFQFYEVVSEISPLISSGGLGEVVTNFILRKARDGHHVCGISIDWETIDHENSDVRYHDTVRTTLLGKEVDVPIYSADLIEILKRRKAIPSDELFPGRIELYLVGRPEVPEAANFFNVGVKGLYGDELRNSRMLSFFVRAALDLIVQHRHASKEAGETRPIVINFHDHMTALGPVYVRASETHRKRYGELRESGGLNGIRLHNPAHQGIYPNHPGRWEDMELNPSEHNFMLEHNANGGWVINTLRGGLLTADYVSPVSIRHGSEIQTDRYGFGLQTIYQKIKNRIRGVTNPIGPEWNSRLHPDLRHPFDESNLSSGREANKREVLKEDFGIDDPNAEWRDGKRWIDRPLLGFTSRLDYQKGVETLIKAIPILLDLRPDLMIEITSDPPDKNQNHPYVTNRSHGDPNILSGMLEIQERYPSRFRYFTFGPRRQAERIAGWNGIMEPTRWEPCGSNQFKAFSMGTGVIGRNTGGVGQTLVTYNTTTGIGNGVLYEEDTVPEFVAAVIKYLEINDDPSQRRQLERNCLHENHTIDARKQEFAGLYEFIGSFFGTQPPLLHKLKELGPTLPSQARYTSVGDRITPITERVFKRRFSINRKVHLENPGNLMIHLHTHMPSVLNHPDGANGEAWLMEAAFSVYVPLAAMLNRLADRGLTSLVSMDFTPTLITQLQNPEFKERFAAYVTERIVTIDDFIRSKTSQGDIEAVRLLELQRAKAAYILELFEKYKRDIIGEYQSLFERDVIEMIETAVSHAYLGTAAPEMRDLQLREGLRQFRKAFSLESRGYFGPEMDYRIGEEKFLAERGLYRWLNYHSVLSSQTKDPGDLMHLMTLPASKFAQFYRIRGTDAVGVIRHPISRFAWDSAFGWGGHPDFLEHWKWLESSNGVHRIRLWRVTGVSEDKQYYNPERAQQAARSKARDFVDQVITECGRAHSEGLSSPVVAVAFDTEFIGHHLGDGIDILENVLLRASQNPELNLTTPANHLKHHPPIASLDPREGGWGVNLDDTTWANPINEYLIRPQEIVSLITRDISRQFLETNDIVVRRIVQQINRLALALVQSDVAFNLYYKHGSGLREDSYFATLEHKRLSDFFVLLQLLNRRLSQTFGDPEEQLLDKMEKRDPILEDVDLNGWLPQEISAGRFKKVALAFKNQLARKRLETALAELDRYLKNTPTWNQNPYQSAVPFMECAMKLTKIVDRRLSGRVRVGSR